MTSVMGWNCFFAGYKDAIRQANELWTAQHPRDESNCVGRERAMIMASPWPNVVKMDGYLRRFVTDSSGSMS